MKDAKNVTGSAEGHCYSVKQQEFVSMITRTVKMMTNEQAIEILRDTPIDIRSTREDDIHTLYATAQNMAIEALQDTRGKANHVVAEIKVDTDEIMERLEQEWYKPNEWIPCSEQLPDAEYGEGDSVLCCTETGLMHILYWDGGNWCVPTGEPHIWVNHKTGWHDKVIAWMPLPEPYSGSTKEK